MINPQETICSTRFKRFVMQRRRQFTIIFLVSLPVTFLWIATTSSSTITPFVFALPIALVITTAVSLVSVPVLWKLTTDKESRTANTRSHGIVTNATNRDNQRCVADMKPELPQRNYVLRPVQKQGWNLQVGTLSSEGHLLYVGKSENILSLRRCYDLSIYSNTGQLLISGEQRKGKPSYLFRFVLVRDGHDVCSIQQPRLFTRRTVFTFSDGDQCQFWRPVFSATYRGESDSGWKYEATIEGGGWNVSIWGLADDMTLLSALTYCFRNDYMNQYT